MDTPQPSSPTPSTTRLRRRSHVPDDSNNSTTLPSRVQVVDVAQTSKESSKTLRWAEVPEWCRVCIAVSKGLQCTLNRKHWQPQDSIFILSGYRRVQFSYAGCFKSLLYIHNETANIFSHLIGSLAFIAFIFSTHTYTMNYTESTRWSDHVVIAIFIVSAVLCLGFSAMFHTCSCHSQVVSAQWNKVDYIGIVLLIVYVAHIILVC